MLVQQIQRRPTSAAVSDCRLTTTSPPTCIYLVCVIPLGCHLTPSKAFPITSGCPLLTLPGLTCRTEARKSGAWDARGRALNQNADCVEAEGATWQLLMQLHGEQDSRSVPVAQCTAASSIPGFYQTRAEGHDREPAEPERPHCLGSSATSLWSRAEAGPNETAHAMPRSTPEEHAPPWDADRQPACPCKARIDWTCVWTPAYRGEIKTMNPWGLALLHATQPPTWASRDQL